MDGRTPGSAIVDSASLAAKFSVVVTIVAHSFLVFFVIFDFLKMINCEMYSCRVGAIDRESVDGVFLRFVRHRRLMYRLAVG